MDRRIWRRCEQAFSLKIIAFGGYFERVFGPLSVLKSYKYILGHKSLEIMYKSSILRHLDYGDVIWDNCSQTISNELEDIHLDALRTIIGTVKGTSHKLIYKESGFPHLKNVAADTNSYSFSKLLIK